MIFAGIVTFQPDLDRLRDNLQAISRQVRKVIIYDNGSTNIESISDLAAQFPNIFVICGGTNVGIAAALNRLAEAALLEGASTLLTLDQDSVCASNMVSTLAAEMGQNVGMVTPYIVDRNKLTLEEFERLCLPRIEQYRQPARRGAITSGALVNLDAWKVVGGFDELFFIDYVDYDFNQRVMEAGYVIYRANRTALLHEVGLATPTWLWTPRRDLAGRWRFERFFAFGHSSTRCYYKARNRVIFTRKHGRKLGLTHEGVWQIPQQILLTLVFESQRAAKLRSFARGVRDGCRVPLR
jgi:rhamnosyltransferase